MSRGTLTRDQLTFDFKGKVIRQMTAFVVASKKPKRVGIPHLQSPKIKYTLYVREPQNNDKGTYFYREITTVDIVTQEKVHSICRITTNLKKFHKIVILSMNIATHYALDICPSRKDIPVMGASISRTFGSCRNSSVPDLMMYRACSSVSLPSR